MSKAPEIYLGSSDKGEVEILSEGELAQKARGEVASRLKRDGMPEAWSATGLVFEDEYLRIFRDPVRFPGGRLGTYVRVSWAERFGPGVLIIPHSNGRLALVRHFRHATRAWHVEFPRGFGDRKATTIDSARRELREEIGAEAQSLEKLGEMYSDSGMTDHLTHIYWAEISEFGSLDQAEGISGLTLMTPVELLSHLVDCSAMDSQTAAALTMAVAKGKCTLERPSLLRRWLGWG